MVMHRSMLGPMIPDHAKENASAPEENEADLTPEQQEERRNKLRASIEDRWEEYGEPNRPVGAE